MNSNQIQVALRELAAETDPTLKHLRLASLVSALFRARAIELVVVGGSAIEFYTEGAYVSGDVDFCVVSSPATLTARLRQEIMAPVQASGGPRSWEVAGLYVDLLGPFENLARSTVRHLEAPYGSIQLCPVEELIVERTLISVYPQEHPPARACAKKLVAAGLVGEVETDWKEVRRLAEHAAYQNWEAVRSLVDEQAQTLKLRSPYDSDE